MELSYFKPILIPIMAKFLPECSVSDRSMLSDPRGSPEKSQDALVLLRTYLMTTSTRATFTANLDDLYRDKHVSLQEKMPN